MPVTYEPRAAAVVALALPLTLLAVTVLIVSLVSLLPSTSLRLHCLTLTELAIAPMRRTVEAPTP